MVKLFLAVTFCVALVWRVCLAVVTADVCVALVDAIETHVAAVVLSLAYTEFVFETVRTLCNSQEQQ